MYIPIQPRSATPNPASNEAWIFLDSENGNAATIKFGCPNCQYLVLGGTAMAAHIGDCDCACELAKEAMEAAKCALEKGMITGEQFSQMIGNLNFYSTSVPDPVTGACTNTISTEAPLLISIATRTNESCSGTADGSATFTTTGGVGAVTVTVRDSGNNVVNPSALPDGTYTATAVDSDGNSASITFIINGSSTPLSSIVGLIAGDSVDVAPQGGTGPYTIAWTGPEGFTSTDFTINMPVAGDYDFEITDAYGCKTNGTVSYGG